MISVLAACVLAASPLGPQERTLLARAGALQSVSVGQWVTYAAHGGGDRVHYFRVAVVGEERDALGRDAAWVEVDFGEHPSFNAPLLQMRFLCAKASGFSASGISRLLVAVGADKPREFATDAVPEVFRLSEPSPAPSTRTDVTKRAGRALSLMTPAGRIVAHPTEIVVGQSVIERVWTSAQVPILQVVRIEMPPIDHRMEVHAFGSDAKSQMVLPHAAQPKIERAR